ncbi:MAG: CPBP family intramembrane metalloprotease [Candidatus Dormibacteraeota bacterium]|nr:CPBP family intramembrane metalloprotease [Candidatus Dormibacteraeota bacterium]
MARLAAIATAAVGLEWVRVLVERSAGPVPAVAAGGLALSLLALGWRPQALGLSRSQLHLRVLGGLALAAVMLLPAAVRWQGAPLLPPPLALSAIAISVGEELAFRGALFAALESLWGSLPAVLGSALLFAAGHLWSHPPAFLLVVLLLGILLGTWRWAARDLVAPIVGHSLADLAL